MSDSRHPTPEQKASKARPGDQIAPIRYRKKPVEIDAIRWSGTNLVEVINFTGLHPSADKWTWEEYEAVVQKDGLKIFTLEGSHMATVGDWIIRGVKGEFYPCKPDIFLMTYERADLAPSETVPIPMVLFCPNCKAQHIDAPSGEWTNPPHRSHECQSCGCTWRPADIPTNGVKAIQTSGKRDWAL